MTPGDAKRLGTLLRLGWDSPWRVRRHLRRMVESPLISARLHLAGVIVGPGARFFGTPVVRRYRGSIISLGSNLEVRSSSMSNVLGLAHRTILTTISADARIELGDSVGLSGATLCAASEITIGDRTLIGADVLITDTDHHALDGPREKYSMEGVAVRPVRIGSDVFVGARAIILKGVCIGDGAVVGAGAVVTSDVPSRAIVAGNPARVVGWAGKTA